MIVTEDVIEKIEELARLAPLHNRPNAQGSFEFSVNRRSSP